MPATEAPLDLEILNENAEIGVEGLRELIDMYLAQAADTMKGLDAAIRSGAAREVNELAHKLAGSSVVCGVNLMVKPLRMLEQRGREGDLTDADQLVADLHVNLEQAQHLLDEYMAQWESK